VLIAGMNLHFKDPAIFKTIGRAGWEQKLFAARFAMTEMLFNDCAIVKFPNVHVIDPDSGGVEILEKGHYRIHALHSARHWVMTGHLPHNIVMEAFVFEAFPIGLRKIPIVLIDDILIRHGETPVIG
jgi:hypothetical protein